MITVRDVTDSYIRYWTCVTFCETADKLVTVTSSSFKMDAYASREIKSLKLCKFSPGLYIISLIIGNKFF